jgi:[acyl-carrier-protein] S-malonyltransferase
MTPWLELDVYAAAIDEMSSASGVDLRKHGTESDADTIRDTAIAQPLIVAASVASFAALKAAAPELEVGAIAGHSVGEIAAATIAGIFTQESGIKFVTARGKAMATAAALEATSMAAVIGGDWSVVSAALDGFGLAPANFNGGGQVVVAGPATGIAELAANAPAGARVIPLQVAGAFHTKYMQPAVSSLSDFASTLEVGSPSLPILTNKDGSTVTSGSDYLSLLINQVSNPVRWDLCMDALTAAGTTALIELSPAGALVGLAKRGMAGVETLAIKTPESLSAAVELIKNQS